MEWIWSAISALAAIVTAIVAIRAVNQTSRDSREKSQPMMVAELRSAQHADSLLVLVVRNAGQTVAHDVVVTFEPPIPRPKDDRSDNSDLIADRYAEPIPQIAPGSELVNTWWGPDYREEPARNYQVIGDIDYDVTIKYRGLGKSIIEDRFRLRTRVATLSSDPVSSNSIRGSLRGIVQALHQLTQKVGK